MIRPSEVLRDLMGAFGKFEVEQLVLDICVLLARTGDEWRPFRPAEVTADAGWDDAYLQRWLLRDGHLRVDGEFLHVQASMVAQCFRGFAGGRLIYGGTDEQRIGTGRAI